MVYEHAHHLQGIWGQNLQRLHVTCFVMNVFVCVHA